MKDREFSLGELRGPARWRLRGAITPSGEKADYAVFSSKKTDYALFSRHYAIPQIRESAFFYIKKVGGFRDFILKRAQFRPLLGKKANYALRGAITRSVIPRAYTHTGVRQVNPVHGRHTGTIK